MKIADIKNERALDVIADMMEPAFRIMSDKRIAAAAREESYMAAVRIAMKEHKSDVLALLAAFDGESVDGYEISLTEIPLKAMELFSDPNLRMLFTWQGQKTESTSSGSAMESTEGEEMQVVSSDTGKKSTKSTRTKK